ncbi:MAG: glycosyltransferase family protein [Phycisphaeraceae bacterium]
MVTGLAATYPFGGVFWDYIQYVLGFHQLGHEVLYLEDTGKWCYSPRRQTFVEEGHDNADHLRQQLQTLEPDLAERWFFRDATGQTFGKDWPQAKAFCRDADLFINVSASCWMREEYFAARRVAFIDSDPMYTQASVPAYLDGTLDEAGRGRIEMLRRHDVFFTFGETIHEADARVPTGLFDWIPTRQPVVLDSFAPHAVAVDRRPRRFTTVASWEPTEDGPFVEGVQYYGKSVEFKRFLDLPRRVSAPIELALSGEYPQACLEDRGFRVRDAYPVSSDPWVYRDYLAHSLGEWSVAKHAYAASLSGWFSCRSACYLALGVPAVVQDTGFSRRLPTGEGLLAFRTLDEAAAAIEEVVARPERHARAARALAVEQFDAAHVLQDLLDRAA